MKPDTKQNEKEKRFMGWRCPACKQVHSGWLGDNDGFSSIPKNYARCLLCSTLSKSKDITRVYE